MIRQDVRPNMPRPVAYAATPVIVQPSRNRSPALFAIFCVGLILFLIAATIILSLIPTYINRGGVTNATRIQTVEVVYVLPNDTILTTGPLNQYQLLVLKNALQQALNNNLQTKDVTIIEVNATATGNSGSRKRRQSRAASRLFVSVEFTCRRIFGCIRSVLYVLRAFIITIELLEEILNQIIPSNPPTNPITATYASTIISISTSTTSSAITPIQTTTSSAITPIQTTTSSAITPIQTTTSSAITPIQTATGFSYTSMATATGFSYTSMATATGFSYTSMATATGFSYTSMATTATSNSLANETRILARRSLKEGGAPASMIYIDSHQMASIKGNVTSISFYVDRTCALATVEFGAFELISRNTDTNAAQLVLSHRSGPVKLGSARELKPYMSSITIRLCSGRTFEDDYDGGCQGAQFPVLPHQYVGIRSNTCRLGFAEPMPNSHSITTWTHLEGSDPFVEPYETLNYVPATHTILQTVTIDPSESNNDQRINERKPSVIVRPRVLFVGTYPPRPCGLAKFLEDLTDSYQGPHSIAVIDENGFIPSARNYSEKVVFLLNQTDRNAYYTLADMVNSQPYDVINIQHEYGLFGGMNGEYILALLAAVRKPVITTMHTILANPNTFYLSLTRAICATSTHIIVLANLGRQLLVDIYGVDQSKISVVHHGVPDVAYTHTLSNSKTQLGFEPDVPIIATFGLLSRNKNIQFALKALPTVVKSVPNALYLILGQTHPTVKSYEGESYRQELENNITSLGLSRNVRFVNKFLDDNELVEYLNAVDIYLTPYAHEDQYVSGTLSWAVGLGKAVVSTPYLYAKELLSDGRGFLVPFQDDQFLGRILTTLLKDDQMRNRARRSAYRYGRQMTWSNVADKHEYIFREVILFS